MSTENPSAVIAEFAVAFESVSDVVSGVLAREDDLSDESRGELSRLVRVLNGAAADGVARAEAVR